MASADPRRQHSDSGQHNTYWIDSNDEADSSSESSSSESLGSDIEFQRDKDGEWQEVVKRPHKRHKAADHSSSSSVEEKRSLPGAESENTASDQSGLVAPSEMATSPSESGVVVSPPRPPLSPPPADHTPLEDLEGDDGLEASADSTPSTPTHDPQPSERFEDTWDSRLWDGYEDSKNSLMQNWTKKKRDLVFGLVMSEGAPQQCKCFVCDKIINAWSIDGVQEKVLRCVDCGRGFFFCAPCGLQDHRWRHQTHKLEAWVPVHHGIDGPLLPPSGLRWKEVIDVPEQLERCQESQDEASEEGKSSPSGHSTQEPLNVSVGPLEYGCACDRMDQDEHPAVVYDPFGLSKLHTDLSYTSCHKHRARTLVTLGFWPMTPIKPKVVVPLKAMVLLYRQRSPFLLWNCSVLCVETFSRFGLSLLIFCMCVCMHIWIAMCC